MTYSVSLTNLSLSELIAAGLVDDQDAFATLFERYKFFAWSVALRVTTNQTVAEEAVVDGFASAFRSLDRLKSPQGFPGYLAACVRNEVLMTVRRSADTAVFDSVEQQVTDGLTPETAYDSDSDARQALAAFQRLNDRQQQAIYLVDFEEVSAEEAAQSLQMSTNALYQLLFRARKALKLLYIAPALSVDAPRLCRDCNDNLAAYVRGTASNRVFAATEAHLGECAECRQRLEDCRNTSELLERANSLVPPAIGLGVASAMGIKTLGATPKVLAGVHKFSLFHFGAVAAAPVVAVGVTLGLLLSSGPPPIHADASVTASPVAPVQRSHPAFVSPPVAPVAVPSYPQATVPPVPTTPSTSPFVAPKVILLPISLSSSMEKGPAGYSTSLEVGSVLDATVTATDPNVGRPIPKLTYTGTLPAGITFRDDGNGTGSFSGTAAVMGGFGGSVTVDGSFASVFIAVVGAPVFTSPTSASATIGDPFSLTVGATGYPAPSYSFVQTQPAGLSFTQGTNGSLTLAGTPQPGTAGTYQVTITATNSQGSTSQTLTLTVL